MKKATGVIALAITILFILGTVMFYFIKNVPSTALHIQTVHPTTGQYSDALVDLNTATKEQLMALPGIGEILAQRILDYRRDHDGFQSLGELMNVPGIGETTLQEILDYITIGGNT